MARARGKFVLDQSGIREVLVGPRGEAVKLAARMARETERNAKTGAPVKTGKLAQRTEADAMPKVSGMRVTTKVEAKQNYSIYVHEGVRGGKVIVPKTAKALRFQIGGRTVFAKSVVQGSQKARPFLLNGARTAGAKLGFKVDGVP